MNPAQLFTSYELLMDQADKAFQETRKAHGACIRCECHCSDCCHAVFGLFLIEAAYIQKHFNKLGRKTREEAILRCGEADRDLERLEKRLKPHKNDPQMSSYALARERIRCPLLDANEECILYPFRPITCRVYGIPTKIQGKGRVCGKSGFEKGTPYPTFDLDGVYRSLFSLSKEILKETGTDNLERASLLISVSKVLNTPLEELLAKDSE
jgi:Fe-S-cluster containining protein